MYRYVIVFSGIINYEEAETILKYIKEDINLITQNNNFMSKTIEELLLEDGWAHLYEGVNYQFVKNIGGIEAFADTSGDCISLKVRGNNHQLADIYEVRSVIYNEELIARKKVSDNLDLKRISLDYAICIASKQTSDVSKMLPLADEVYAWLTKE